MQDSGINQKPTIKMMDDIFGGPKATLGLLGLIDQPG